MVWIILALFIGVPLIEISVFIEVGQKIGALPTVAITVLTAVAGTLLLRVQGLNTLHRAQAAMQRQEAPVAELFQGVFLFLAGLMLLIPGFFTDAIGFLIFLPPIRHYLARRAMGHLKTKHQHMHGQSGFSQSWHDGQRSGDIIEGDYDIIDPEARQEKNPDHILPGEPSKDSPWAKDAANDEDEDQKS